MTPGAVSPGPGSALRRAVGLVALVAAAVVLVAATHEISIGREEVAAADAAAKRGSVREAIAHARAAAEAYVPASPWPALGVARLLAIARDAEARGDADTALLAYGAVRTAAIATHGSAFRLWRSDAEAGLARVATWSAASAANPAGMAANATSAAAATIGGAAIHTHDAGPSMLEALRRDDGPPRTALAALSAAVLAILGGALGLAFALRDARSQRVAQSLVVAGLLTCAVVLLLN